MAKSRTRGSRETTRKGGSRQSIRLSEQVVGFFGEDLKKKKKDKDRQKWVGN